MRKIPYKYIAAGVYAVALFMDLLDTTIVNVALPTLARTFGTTATGIEWVVTGYLLSLAVFIPVSGWAGDRFGTKRTFLVALAIFTGGSLACSLAPTLGWLVLARVVQGVGGGMLTPVGAAMVYRAFRPSERARIGALITVPAVVAPAAGPVVGGLLDAVAQLALDLLAQCPNRPCRSCDRRAGSRRAQRNAPGEVRRSRASRSERPDSAVCSMAWRRPGRRDSRIQPSATFGLAGIAAAAAFVVVELRTAEPMLDLRLFRDSLFRAGNSVQILAFGAQFGTLFLLPLLLQAERGLTPLQSGLTTFPQALGVMSMVPVAARIYRAVGPRRMSFAGLLLAAAATLPLAAAGLSTDLWWIRLSMLARGWGFALSLTAMQAATFATVSSTRLGRGTAIYSVARQVGTSLTVAVLATLLSGGLFAVGATLGNPADRAAAVTAFRAPFLASAAIALAGALFALTIDDRTATAALGKDPDSADGAAGPASVAAVAEAMPIARGA